MESFGSNTNDTCESSRNKWLVPIRMIKILEPKFKGEWWNQTLETKNGSVTIVLVWLVCLN